MPYNINDAIKQAEKDYGLGKGEYFKAQEGANRIRVLSHLEPYQSEYQGQPNFKFVCWIVDRKDGIIKPYFMPVTIANAIGALQQDPDYAFEDMPMPYDLTINAKGAGTKEVVYQVTAARQNTPLTDDEKKTLAARISVGEFVAKLKEKNAAEAKSAPVNTLDAIPGVFRTDLSEDAVLADINEEFDEAAKASKFAQVVAQKTAGKFGATNAPQ